MREGFKALGVIELLLSGNYDAGRVFRDESLPDEVTAELRIVAVVQFDSLPSQLEQSPIQRKSASRQERSPRSSRESGRQACWRRARKGPRRAEKS